MRYLVKARLKAGKEKPLQKAVADGSLGRGSVADILTHQKNWIWNIRRQYGLAVPFSTI